MSVGRTSWGLEVGKPPDPERRTVLRDRLGCSLSGYYLGLQR